MSTKSIAAWPSPRLRPALILLSTIGFFAAAPGLLLDAVLFALGNLALVGPVILIGLAMTAGITATGSMGLIAAAFEGRQVRMIAVASLVGALTPVCGISVLPLVAGLLAGGVPLAPIMAFWLSSPITDPGMLAITAATLGPAFAATKTCAAFGVGLFGGAVTLALTASGCIRRPARQRSADAPARKGPCCTALPKTVRWRFWRSRDRREIFRKTALDTGRLMLFWLTAAFIAEFLFQRFVPDEVVVSILGGEGPWLVPMAAIVGAPIYLDGYAALPLIRGLIDAGMRSDAAMAFLVAGGITSAWAAIPVFALVRLPAFLLYLVLAVTGSVLAGWASGLVLA